MGWFTKNLDCTTPSTKVIIAENASLKQQVADMQRLIDELNSSITACKPVLDFDAMRVFSIERNVNNNRPCTIVGFWTQKPVLSADGEMIVNQDVHKEWYLYCNNDRHAELIEEFKQWKSQNLKDL